MNGMDPPGLRTFGPFFTIKLSSAFKVGLVLITAGKVLDKVDCPNTPYKVLQAVLPESAKEIDFGGGDLG